MTDEQLKEWQKIAADEGVSDGVVLPCPCGQPVALGFQNNEPVVFHRLPRCKAFDEKEPDVYATYVRHAMTKKLGGEVGA